MQQIINMTLVFALAVLGLSACGRGESGVGVSTTVESSNTTDQSQSVGRSKSLRLDQTQKQVQTIPALLPLAAAIRVDGHVQDCALPALPSHANEVERFTYLKRLRAYIGYATRRIAGWEVDPLSLQAERYASGLRKCAHLANTLLTEVVIRLPSAGALQADKAEEQIRDVYFSLDVPTVRRILAEVDAASSGPLTLDLSGTSGVQFSDAMAAYEFSPDGFLIRKPGGEWFGKGGYLSGKRIDLVLDTSSSASMSRDNKIDQRVTAGSSDKVQADVGVK